MNRIDLSGPWRLRDTGRDHDVPLTLPGDAISALVDADVLPDPYWGRNEYDCRWVAERDWTLRREVTLDRTDLTLVIDQLDTVATVRLNGVMVLEANNAFLCHRVDVSGAARIGTNLIEITFASSVRVAAERQAAQPFFVPFQAENSVIPNPNMLRKPQCDFGWDWNIALAPFGVYGDIFFEPMPTARIESLHIAQHHSDGAVRVDVTAQITGDRAGDVVFAFNGQDISVEAGSEAKASFDVANPELWWPAGLGEQRLYDLTVTLGAQVETRQIGLRQFEHVTTPDEIGASFAFRVNGHPVFCRGANWIPADALPSRISREKIRDLLQSAVDANMNMIRVWGGGRYEPDWFYDLCDELGLMVWQDLMFACALYPSDEAFLSEVEIEVSQTVARLHHHASIALWCGDNENVGALTWFEESRQNRDRYLAAYDRLNYACERALKQADPQAIWWPSSPSRGRLDFGDAWHDDTAGDMHFWSVWHEGRDFDHYRDVGPRFCSEFGFQSYPSMDQIRSFCAPEDFNIAAPVLESHQKNRGGNARIAETMFRYFRFPVGFEDFVYLSQVQQALAIKTAVTHWRSLKPRCMGTLIWQLNDTWPVCSWSSLDYGGGWKLLHYAAQHSFAPGMVTAVPRGDEIALVAVNDMRAEASVSLSISAIGTDGTLRSIATAKAQVLTDAARDVACIPTAEIRADELLIFDWEWSDGRRGQDHYTPRPYKSLDLKPSGLNVAQDGNTFVLSSDRPALFTALEADIPGRFSDNGVLVLPGADVTLNFLPQTPGATANATARDLYSATYGPTKERRTHA
ncbi:MAG: glycoside hydrolase family 2 protein [Rhodobacteraceae bacterium]|nr:glycoside hydrolase family 2 protein [Paracoccaceae bacterium]